MALRELLVVVQGSDQPALCLAQLRCRTFLLPLCLALSAEPCREGMEGSPARRTDRHQIGRDTESQLQDELLNGGLRRESRAPDCVRGNSAAVRQGGAPSSG